MRRSVHQFQLFSPAAIQHLNHYVTLRRKDTFCCTSLSTQCGSALSCRTFLWIMTIGETPGRPYDSDLQFPAHFSYFYYCLGAARYAERLKNDRDVVLH